jgi:hypothetical protein
MDFDEFFTTHKNPEDIIAYLVANKICIIPFYIDDERKYADDFKLIFAFSAQTHADELRDPYYVTMDELHTNGYSHIIEALLKHVEVTWVIDTWDIEPARIAYSTGHAVLMRDEVIVRTIPQALAINDIGAAIKLAKYGAPYTVDDLQYIKSEFGQKIQDLFMDLITAKD